MTRVDGGLLHLTGLWGTSDLESVLESSEKIYL